MRGKVWSFVVGFGLGVVSLTVFRREANLTGQIEVFALLSLVGLLLLMVLWNWFRRIQQRVRLQPGKAASSLEGEWAGYLWASISLLMVYLALTLIVVFI